MTVSSYSKSVKQSKAHVWLLIFTIFFWWFFRRVCSTRRLWILHLIAILVYLGITLRDFTEKERNRIDRLKKTKNKHDKSSGRNQIWEKIEFLYYIIATCNYKNKKIGLNCRQNVRYPTSTKANAAHAWPHWLKSLLVLEPERRVSAPFSI